MHTAHSLTVSHSIGGAVCPTHRMQTPWMQITLGCIHPLDADAPGHVTCDAYWEATAVNRQTGVKTLPSQTSFVGGN